ncbi:MAG: DNA polymerase III subunit beta [Candidatus Omnitrophota bacterium]
MKIKVKRENIVKGISIVIAAVNPRGTLPILSNILIETLNTNQIKLTGTDLEIGIINIMDAEVLEEGTITIPAKKFSDIVREAPKEEIEITVSKNNSIQIKSGKAFFKLMGLAKDDYPKFPSVSLENAITLEQKVLKECIKLIAFAISTDETRYVLNGALVSIKNKELKMIATDGRRLAAIESEVTVPKSVNVIAIIPTKAISEINKNIQEEGTIQLIESGNQIVFCVGDTTIISRLIEGNFPNYKQVIPTEEEIVVTVNREKFLAAMRRVSLLTSLEAQAVKLDVVKTNKIILSSRAPNLGESKEEIDATIEKGGEITIGFNPHYVIDVLKNIDIEEIRLSLISPEKPGVIKGREGYVYVIMPMQIG